jgi:ABC-type branched-subunit amino acid transport system permease subunit
VLGAIMMGTMIFMPKGLVPSLALLAASVRARKAPAWAC